MSIYLQQLTVRLAQGLGRLPEADRQRHTEYFLTAQQEDGGFAGRMGGSDLYYTAFGLRALSILGKLYGDPAERAAGFLRQQLTQQQTIVDFFSLFYAANLLKVSSGIDVFSESKSDWRDNVATFLESLRRDDGGYAKAPEGHAGSTYHTFLVVLVTQLLERSVERPEEIVAFLDARRDPSNPSAAAVATLKIIADQTGRSFSDYLSNETKELTLDYLCEMQTDEGGIRANTRIPIADLLSSFTVGLTLCDLDSFDELDIDLYAKFVDSMKLPSGGFQAAAWDDAHDVEYSFYGLGCVALLN